MKEPSTLPEESGAAVQPSGHPSGEGPGDGLLRALRLERLAVRDVLRRQRLLEEQNQELVRSLLQLESAGAPSAEYIAELEQKISQLTIRNSLLKGENSQLIEESQKLVDENNNLLKLHVASHRLHSTLFIGEVLDVVSEILLNLVGASTYAIFFHQERESALVPVLTKGLEDAAARRVPIRTGIIGNATLRNEIFVAQPPAAAEASLESPLAVIPLRFRERILGTIAIFQLLPHKPFFNSADDALFDLIATQAATAIHSAKLFTESEKKVSKMKEFLSQMQAPGGAAEEGGGAA